MTIGLTEEQEILEFIRPAAREFREVGFEIERDPGAINHHLDTAGVRSLAYTFIPEEYGGRPLVTSTGKRLFFLSCSERVLTLEALAYGDAGVLLASPGPSLSGHILLELGSEEQKQRFYPKLMAKPTWTFFAMTERDRGSDAGALTTALTKDPSQPHCYLLNGEKYLVGNGARAEIGVVFARSTPGPLGIEIVLVDTERAGYSAEVLPTLGLKGAAISRIKFDNYQVDDRDIIGKPQFTPTKRGLWGAIKTFNRMRPGVAAIALGVAQATYDYISQNRRELSEREKDRMEGFAFRLLSVRASVREAARLADSDSTNATLAAVAKIRAVELVEEITNASFTFFGPGAMWEHPYLNKWYRDARGFEYMEGTSIIQKLRLFESVSRGKLTHV